jgi:hypothetical protein
MDKDLIKSLYQRGDPKRKKVLYEAFQNLFHSSFSYEQIILSINQELGESVVIHADVKYIREKFVKDKKKNKQQMLNKCLKSEDTLQTIGVLEEISQEVSTIRVQKITDQNQDFYNKFLNKK